MKKMIILLFSIMIIMSGCTGQSKSNADLGDDSADENTNSAVEANPTDIVEETEADPSEYQAVIEYDFKEEDEYRVNSSDKVNIILNNEDTEINGTGADYQDGTLTVTKAGVYELTGNLTAGGLVVDVSADGNVNLILNGVTIINDKGAAVFVKQADKVIISTVEGSTNVLTDAVEYTDINTEENEPCSAIYSKDDLVLNGEGTLIVNGNFNNAIQGKDDVIITSGNYVIKSVDDGIIGKDCLVIQNGSFEITADGDAMRSTNDTDTEKGYVYIENGSFVMTAGCDCIQAVTSVTINDGTFDITTGGGSIVESELVQASEQSDDSIELMSTEGNNGMTPPEEFDGMTPSEGFDRKTPPEGFDGSAPTEGFDGKTPPDGNKGFGGRGGFGQWGQDSSSDSTDTASAKAIKASGYITINGGNFNINSSDDAIHSNYNLIINSGAINITSGDDGIHADNELIVNNGSIMITKSYEGLEAAVMNINNGLIDITSRDDGINIAGGNDGSSVNGRMGQNFFAANDDNRLCINGGEININADGDGLDSNGHIEMNDGNVIVNGPVDGGNGALDYAGSFIINGGTLIAAGSTGMAQNVSEDSEQVSILYGTDMTEGDKLTVTDTEGKEILTYSAVKKSGCLIFSNENLKTGNSYILLKNGEELETITITETVSDINISSNSMWRR